jgi:hypothetical protein
MDSTSISILILIAIGIGLLAGLASYLGSKKEKRQPERVKRNFDNVGWRWLQSWPNGRPSPDYQLFEFDNGLKILVLKESRETFDGMAWYILEEFLPDGSFRRARITGWTYHGGADEKEVIELRERISKIKR